MASNSKSNKARLLIEQGVSNKEIARRTGLNITTIYTIKWKMAKKQGLGAIKPQTLPVGQGTGITSVPRAKVPLEFEIIDRKPKQSNKRRNAQIARRARERVEREKQNLMNSIPRSNYGNFYGDVKITKPSLWQRVKAVFTGA